MRMLKLTQFIGKEKREAVVSFPRNFSPDYPVKAEYVENPNKPLSEILSSEERVSFHIAIDAIWKVKPDILRVIKYIRDVTDWDISACREYAYQYLQIA